MLYIHYFALETAKSLNFYKIHLVFIGYGQLCDADIVEALSEQVLQSATAGVPIQSCLVGDVVLALYRDDENWYRAKIVSVNPDCSSFQIDIVPNQYEEQQPANHGL
jgi:hypothetical protein